MTDVQTLIAALAAAPAAPLRVQAGRGGAAGATTWRDLEGETTVLARRMANLALSPGERIGLMAETSLDFVRLLLACQKAGLVPVPLPLPSAFGDRAAHAGRLARMLTSAGARAAFASPAQQGVLPRGLNLRGGPADLDALPERAVDLPAVGPDDPAFIQFSSGSTRHPMGVVVRQRQALANARAIRIALAITPGDHCISWLPLYHDMGLVGCLLAPLSAGMALDLIPTLDFVRNPLCWPRLMSELGGTISFAPGFGYDLAARRAFPEVVAGLDLAAWRVAGVGGDVIRAEVLARFAQAFAPAGFHPRSFVPSYGLAEATLAVTISPPGRGVVEDAVDLDALERRGEAVVAQDGARVRRLVRCGAPLPGMEVAVRDPAGPTLPDRRVGRVQVRGASVMAGYFHQPEETARVLDPAGWLDTGDLGFLVDGELVITGRAKDLIIVNGRNLWPQDLEWAAEQVRPLRPGDVAAISHDGADGEQVVLLVQCRVPEPGDRDRLARAVGAAVMAASGVLCRVVLVPPRSLPRTSSGKLARAHARRLLSEGPPA